MVIPVNNTLLGNFEDRAGNRINFDVLTLMRIGGVPSVSVSNGRISEVIIRNEHIEVEQNGYIRNTAMALFSKDIGFNQLLDSFGLRDGMDDY